MSAPEAAGGLSAGKRIARAMFVVLFFHLFWKFGGFLLRIALGSEYGLSDMTDAYATAFNTIIMGIFFVVEESMGPAFLPVFIYRMKESGEEKAWEFGRTVFYILLVTLCLVVILGVVFAPQITDFAVPGFEGEDRAMSREYSLTLVQIGFPGLLAMALGSLTYVMLNAYKVFSYPAAGDSAQKFLMVAVFLGLSALLGASPMFIGIGFLAGAAAKILIHFIGLKGKLGFLKPGLHLRGPDMRKFLILLVPLLLGILVAKYRDLYTNARTASYLAEGQPSAIDWAKRLGDFPIHMVPYALSIAMFPYLCDIAKEKDFRYFGQIVTSAIKLVTLFLLPLTIVMIVLRVPVVQFVYHLGEWTDVNTYWTSIALACYVSALIFYAVEPILMQSFFSMQNTWIPVTVGLAASLAQIAGLYAAVNYLQLDRFYCVALAFPMSRILKNIVLVGLMRRRIPILPTKDTMVYAGKMLIICAAVGVAVYVMDSAVSPKLTLSPDANGFFNPMVAARLAASSLAGIAVMVTLCFALRLKEAQLIVEWLRTEGLDRIRGYLGRKA